MILKLLLNTRMIWMIFIKILKNTIQIKTYKDRKITISLVFISQSYFAVPKNIRLNSTHYFIMKIPNKRKPQQIAFNHSSDIDF